MLSAVLGQTLTIERRVHPFGEKGTRSSLEECAKKIVADYQHPAVSTWSIECFERARKEEGLKVETDLQRAQILLRAVQRKLWVPDPVGTEYMAAAHLMACDRSTKDKLCILPSDCDDHVILLGACYMSVGLNFMVVGHSYNKAKQIEHVLGAVRIGKGKAGRWHYADPSTDWPLGKCLDGGFRERLISLPDMKVRCDDDVCIKKDPSQWDPDASGFVEKGTFIGVSGISPEERPVFAWLAGPDEIPSGMLGVSQTQAEDLGSQGAVAACAAYGIPPGSPLSSVCSGIGGEIGKFVYKTVDALTASTDTGTPLDPEVQSQAMAAVWEARKQLRGLLNLTIKKVAVAAHVTPAAAALAISKYVRVGQMQSLPKSNGAWTVCALTPLGIDKLPRCVDTGFHAYCTGNGLSSCPSSAVGWWEPGTTLDVAAITSGQEPYVAMSVAHARLLIDTSGMWALNVGAFGAGMGAIKTYAETLLKKAVPNALADLALPGSSHEGAGSGSSSSKKRSYFWPIAGTVTVGGLIWWATNPLGKAS